eukprot:gnl/MRDRNA2_/MRDRNA2_54471_c0_seq1.p1 gnl/MRDRNA2_/MRDRNA2_54471_c0~~gnl/MRDRNA2_/MRDRNA2_54471_c0_seq1.p1  ORF type:complete len:203 (+),score=30.84 gnl/MRDRNA2_/MRDRNA2_54471_c0_seq1:42-650(+)
MRVLNSLKNPINGFAVKRHLSARRACSGLFRAQQQADNTASCWSDAAHRYEEAFGEEYAGFASSALDALLARMGNDFKDLLDIGCGSGAVLAALSEGHPAFRQLDRMLAVDFSPGMLEVYRRHARSARAKGALPCGFDVRIARMDGQRLRAAGYNRFSAASGLFSIIFFPDRHAGLKEMWRVLKPGGHAVISSWGDRIDWIA